MQKSMFRKSWVIGIIILFVGACVTPSISGDIKPSVFLESKKLKNNNIAPLVANLSSYWSFNEGEGDIAYDYSGNGNDGTISGASWTTGICEYALNFDGVDDYVMVPDSQSLDIIQEITLSAWVNFDTINTNYPPVIIFKRGDGDDGDEKYKLGVGDYQSIAEFRINSDPVEGGDLNTGQWYHIVGTFNGSIKRLYLNGIEVAEETQVTTIQTSSRNLYIGADRDSGGFNQHVDGIIDEIRIYNKALSEVEVLFLYENPCGGNIAPTVEITYPVEDQIVNGTITINGTSNDFDGTVELVEVKIDHDGDWDNATGTTSWTYEWNTTTVPDGWHTIIARSYDGELYSLEARVSVIVDNEINDPPYKPERPTGNTSLEIGEEGLYKTSTTDPDGDQIYYKFDWGDGTNSSWLGPYDSDDEVEIANSWDSSGTYKVRARAKDEHNALSNWSDSLSVEIIGENQPPVASFTWAPEFPYLDETISFNASDSFDPDGTIVLYEWDWDDDGMFDENHTSSIATYNWSQAGIYPVTLRVTDNNSLTDNVTKIVHVGCIILISISGGFRIGLVIKNICSIPITNIEWSIDLDGGIIIFGRHTDGVISSLAPYETKTVRQPILFGIGKDVVITVTADGSSKQVVAKWVLGPLVLGVT